MKDSTFWKIILAIFLTLAFFLGSMAVAGLILTGINGSLNIGRVVFVAVGLLLTVVGLYILRTGIKGIENIEKEATE